MPRRTKTKPSRTTTARVLKAIVDSGKKATKILKGEAIQRKKNGKVIS